MLFVLNLSLLLLIFINVLFSYRGFINFSFFDRYKLNVGEIIYSRQYNRLFTSAFLHEDWMHLIFNMFSLFFFAPIIIEYTSEIYFLVLYFISVIGGSLSLLILNKHKSYFSAVGSSGGVTGIVFSSIYLFPEMTIGVFFIPMPAWIFGLVYLTYSLFGMKKQFDNIGHEAHIGGAIFGLVSIFLYYPVILFVNFWFIIPMLLPILYFIYEMFLKKNN